MDINVLLTYAVEHNASDLHLSAGLVPLVRVDGMLQQVAEAEKLDGAVLHDILRQILLSEDITLLSTRREIDCTFNSPTLGRFRINVFHQSQGIAVALRVIPKKIPTFAELGFSDIFYQICNMPNGLVVLAGPTGSGKTTTIASVLEYINATQNGHIVTLEDPIEYAFEPKRCLVHQREIGIHTESFGAALRAVLREDPDYIFVGEMRDLETIKLALTAAETGHLVFATLHTSSAAETINRIVDVFQASEKAMVRSILASSLRAVISQVLVKRKNGGRVAAQEIMICNSAIKNMIREDKTHQIYSVIQTGHEVGMRTLEQHLQELIKKGMVDAEQ